MSLTTESTESLAVPNPEYKIRHILRGHTAAIKSIKFSPNGKWLATAAEDSIFIWDAYKGTFLKELSGHIEIVNDIAWSPNSYLFISASDDRCLILRGFPSGKCLQTYEDDHKKFNTVAFDLSGDSIAAGTNDGEIFIWSNVRNRYLEGICNQVIVHNTWVASVIFLNYTAIISSCYDATCLKWNYASNIYYEPFSEPPEDPAVIYAEISPCQKFLLLSHLNQTYTSWEIKRNFYINLYSHEELSNYPVIGSFCFTGNRQLVVAGSVKKCVYIWDFRTAKLLQTLNQNVIVSVVASHPTENIIASSGSDNSICLWKSDV